MVGKPALQVGGEHDAVIVADDGPGIPDAEKPKAAQRFFRGDASRGTPGVGLGLSLVEAVAKLHGGALELADNHPGLLVQMTLEAGAVAARETLAERARPIEHAAAAG